MATITLPDLPETLYRPLAARAARHGTTVEHEAVQALQEALRQDEASSANAVASAQEIRRVRESLKGIYVTEVELQRAKRDGRP